MRLFLGALLVLLAAWLAGCSPQPSGATYPDDARGAMWPFWPTQMRFHPLTRLVKEATAGVWVIEARIEFRDADGAMSKAIGEMVIQLEDGASPRGSASAVQTWNKDLRDLSVNREQFDEVIRTYLFRLEVDASKFPQQPVLGAYFVGADGRELKATIEVRQ